jgi:hypothetical protein
MAIARLEKIVSAQTVRIGRLEQLLAELSGEGHTSAEQYQPQSPHSPTQRYHPGTYVSPFLSFSSLPFGSSILSESKAPRNSNLHSLVLIQSSHFPTHPLAMALTLVSHRK